MEIEKDLTIIIYSRNGNGVRKVEKAIKEALHDFTDTYEIIKEKWREQDEPN